MHDLMHILDSEVARPTRQELMESCGRHCIGTTITEKALELRAKAKSVDDLLARLNEAHIGGSFLRREGEIIYAEYQRCYCGSVSRTRKRFSPTYCYCSCGWFRQLFEAVFERSVRVELLGSIIQGDPCCRFKIHFQ